MLTLPLASGQGGFGPEAHTETVKRERKQDEEQELQIEVNSFQNLGNELNHQGGLGGFSISLSTICECSVLCQPCHPGQQAGDTISLSPALNSPASKCPTRSGHSTVVRSLLTGSQVCLLPRHQGV